MLQLLVREINNFTTKHKWGGAHFLVNNSEQLVTSYYHCFWSWTSLPNGATLKQGHQSLTYNQIWSVCCRSLVTCWALAGTVSVHFWPGWLGSHLHAIYSWSSCEWYQMCKASWAGTVYCSVWLFRFDKDGCEKKWNSKKMQCTNSNQSYRNSGGKWLLFAIAPCSDVFSEQ